jgi:hypothetical protein
MAQLQAQKAQRDLNTPDLRKIEQGNNIITQEQQPDGSYKPIATAPRFAPQQSAASALAQKLALMDKFGATEDDKKRALGIRVAADDPTSWDDGITPDQQKIVQGLANYSYPISSKFLQTAANQQLVARAQMLNPDLNVPQYQQNAKLLADFASSSPTSLGGSVTAVNTAASHLAELKAASDQLPDHIGSLNALQNFGAQKLDTKGAVALKNWNTGVQLMAAEVQKMVKAGVATEGETKDMLANLNANDPLDQRRAALATLGQFMYEKAEALQAKRDEILKSRSPGTSLLRADAQKKLGSVIQDGGRSVPEFGPPSNGLGYGPAGQSATPQVAQPQPVSNGGWSVRRVD